MRRSIQRRGRSRPRCCCGWRRSWAWAGSRPRLIHRRSLRTGSTTQRRTRRRLVPRPPSCTRCSNVMADHAMQSLRRWACRAVRCGGGCVTTEFSRGKSRHTPRVDLSQAPGPTRSRNQQADRDRRRWLFVITGILEAAPWQKTSSMHRNDLSSVVHQYLELAERLQAAVEELPLGISARESIPRRLWLVANQDCAAFGALLRAGHAVSALALLRPQTEAFLRGFWSKLCAQDDALAKIAAGTREFPKISAVRDELEKRHPKGLAICGRSLKSDGFKSTHLQLFHDLTHRGSAALDLVLSTNSSAAGSPPEVLLVAAAVCANVGSFSAAAALEDCGRVDDARRLLAQRDAFDARIDWLTGGSERFIAFVRAYVAGLPE